MNKEELISDMIEIEKQLALFEKLVKESRGNSASTSEQLLQILSILSGKGARTGCIRH